VLILILVLLLLAAIFGVLGAVLKVALILVLASVLAITVLIWGGWLYAKHRMRAWQAEADRRLDAEARRRRAIDVRHVPNEADGERSQGPPPGLGRGGPGSV
jgi:threonine/homoserine/homoserine lactone efflux protein